MTSSCFVWKWLPGAIEPVVAGELRRCPSKGWPGRTSCW